MNWFAVVAIAVLAIICIGKDVNHEKERRATCAALGGTLVRVETTKKFQCIDNTEILYEIP